MIMQDQSKRLSQPLQWTRASRLAVLAAVLVLVLGGAVAAVIGSRGGSPVRRGCIEVTVPSTLGGAVVRQCGATARGMCAQPAQNPGLAANGALRDACRRTGLPYGRASG
jgi:hypothetical protein